MVLTGAEDVWRPYDAADAIVVVADCGGGLFLREAVLEVIGQGARLGVVGHGHRRQLSIRELQILQYLLLAKRLQD